MIMTRTGNLWYTCTSVTITVARRRRHRVDCLQLGDGGQGVRHCWLCDLRLDTALRRAGRTRCRPRVGLPDRNGRSTI